MAIAELFDFDTHTDHWQDLAVCKGRTTLFFAPKAERPQARARREAKAQKLCAVCPVQRTCRSYARTNRGQLSLESVTFLRGRSLQRQFVVIDEAQNLEPTTLRTILTRVGDGTKVIFTGDTSQIDAPYLGESNNALSVLASAFAGQRCFGHITLTACERSDVASLAAELL